MTGTPFDAILRFMPLLVGGGLIVILVMNWRRLGPPADGRDGDDGPEPCVHCGYDVRGGLERCPECGRPTPAFRRNRLADLRTRWPTETLVPRSPGFDEVPVVVLTTDDGPAVDLLVQHLEARGIAARVALPQPIGHAAYQQVMGGHKLIVWSEDADRARAIIGRLWVDSGVTDRSDVDGEAGG
jgi:hypothetical protein